MNEDNEKAIITFKDDPEVLSSSLKMLQELDVMKDPCLSTYLILACEGLKDPSERKTFESLGHKVPSKQMQEDIKAILKVWSQE